MVYVFIQFALLTYLLLNIKLTNLSFFTLLFFSTALFIGLFSIFSMGVRNLSIFPRVKKNAQFVAKGPYKVIRHPMYTALIFSAIAVLTTNIFWDTILVGLLLLVVLLFKLKVEEKELEKVFPEYKSYKNNTYYLLPYLY